MTRVQLMKEKPQSVLPKILKVVLFGTAFVSSKHVGELMKGTVSGGFKINSFKISPLQSLRKKRMKMTP